MSIHVYGHYNRVLLFCPPIFWKEHVLSLTTELSFIFRHVQSNSVYLSYRFDVLSWYLRAEMKDTYGETTNFMWDIAYFELKFANIWKRMPGDNPIRFTFVDGQSDVGFINYKVFSLEQFCVPEIGDELYVFMVVIEVSISKIRFFFGCTTTHLYLSIMRL